MGLAKHFGLKCKSLRIRLSVCTYSIHIIIQYISLYRYVHIHLDRVADKEFISSSRSISLFNANFSS